MSILVSLLQTVRGCVRSTRRAATRGAREAFPWDEASRYLVVQKEQCHANEDFYAAGQRIVLSAAGSRSGYSPTGRRSLRSQRASVLGSMRSRAASSFCDMPWAAR